MIDLSLSTDDDLAVLVTDLVNLKTKVLRRVAREVIPPVERELDRALVQYTPPRPDYPIRWKSEKQRRFVLAKLRRENNLPYRRTGALQRAWVIETTIKDGTITVSARNDAPQARYVYPPDQQPYLDKWPDAPELVLDAALKINEGLEYAVDKEIAAL